MKYWLTVIIGWVVAVFLLLAGFNEYMRRQMIKVHGRDVGMALWRQWRL